MSENEKNTRKVPKLRFPGFTDDWEQRKVFNIFDSIVEKGFPELPVLSATQDRGMVIRAAENRNISYDDRNKTGYKRVCPKQFVIHLRSFQGGFAHSIHEGITSPAYTIIQLKSGQVHNDFFGNISSCLSNLLTD